MTFTVTRILGALIGVALATMGHVQSQQSACSNVERTIAERLAREGDDYDARVAVLTMTDRELAMRHDRETLAPDSFDPRHDCKELMDAIVPLRAAVSATRSPDRSVVVAALDKLAAPCR